MEVNISELSDKKTINDYPKDTLFVWSEKRRKIDPETGYPIYEFNDKNTNIEEQ